MRGDIKGVTWDEIAKYILVIWGKVTNGSTRPSTKEPKWPPSSLQFIYPNYLITMHANYYNFAQKFHKNAHTNHIRGVCVIIQGHKLIA
jgi:hypothetical protein